MPGSGLTPILNNNPIAPYNFGGFTSTNYDATANTINLGTTHNFVTGDSIWQWNDSLTGTVQNGGIVLLQRYYVIVINATTIQLATSLENANSGIPFDFSAPTSYAATQAAFAKFPGWSINRPPSIHLAYAKSNILFNSSVPVEINFRVPSFTPITTNTHNPLTCVLRQPETDKYWGAIMSQRNGTYEGYLAAYNGTSIGVNTQAAAFYDIFPTAFSLGHNQRYVITPARTIECWYGAVGSAMTLYYTSTALSPNTSLVLEFGTSFSFARVTDCNIKYL